MNNRKVKEEEGRKNTKKERRQEEQDVHEACVPVQTEE